MRHSGNRLITTSLAISNHFNKRHKNILRDIENLECSQEFRRLNFAPTSYKTSQGKILPAYEITRDGFVFLCMGFTGTKAAQWKEKYIAAFNELERQVNQNSQLTALKYAYLQVNPEAAKLLHYREIGLSFSEIGKILGIADSTICSRLKKLALLGLCDYAPNPVMVERGRKGNIAMRLAQQSLELEG